MDTPQSMEDVRKLVEESGDVKTLSMFALREAHGAGRLGVHVRANISKALASLGLSHYPTDLPDSQYEQVRIYRQGTAVATLINACLRPGVQYDEELRLAASRDSAAILDRIRELVCVDSEAEGS